MGDLGERLGSWDDRSGPDGGSLGTYVVGSLIGSALVAIAVGLLGPPGYLVAIALPLVSLVPYVTWRRRRNQRLTGSPTSWPETM